MRGIKIALLIILMFPSFAVAERDFSPLVEAVFSFNAKALESSLSDGSYRGEEGYLRLPAEVAQSLGMRAYVDDDYLRARDLYEQAEGFLEDAIDGLHTRAREKSKGDHEAKVSRSACLYQKTMQSAEEKLMGYRATLMNNKDDRFDRSQCSVILVDLIKKALEKYKQNLRDALGWVYNRCQGIDPLDGYPLTPENVRFVNSVFNYYVQKARVEDLDALDLDRLEGRAIEGGTGVLKNFLGKTELRYFSFLEPAMKRYGGEEYAAESLLFMALMRQESRFDPKAVSYVGAAGITQIMPSTGKLLGMATIFSPPYFGEARKVMLKERRLKAQALELISEPEEFCRETDARTARRIMQQALSYKKKRVGLYRRYKRELLKEARDDRLNPQKAIEGGYRLFAELLNRQKGDISLALAAYNAGSRAVKKYNGLPPYRETVSYRNRVLRYYREYLDRAGSRGAGLKQGG